MANTVTTSATENSKLIWQNVNEGIPEPALLITPYIDCIQIEQADQTININYETVNELCKVIKNLKEPE